MLMRTFLQPGLYGDDFETTNCVLETLHVLFPIWTNNRRKNKDKLLCGQFIHILILQVKGESWLLELKALASPKYITIVFSVCLWLLYITVVCHVAMPSCYNII